MWTYLALSLAGQVFVAAVGRADHVHGVSETEFRRLTRASWITVAAYLVGGILVFWVPLVAPIFVAILTSLWIVEGFLRHRRNRRHSHPSSST
jgi:uncharacterized membrane protein